MDVAVVSRGVEMIVMVDLCIFKKAVFVSIVIAARSACPAMECRAQCVDAGIGQAVQGIVPEPAEAWIDGLKTFV